MVLPIPNGLVDARIPFQVEPHASVFPQERLEGFMFGRIRASPLLATFRVVDDDRSPSTTGAGGGDGFGGGSGGNGRMTRRGAGGVGLLRCV